MNELLELSEDIRPTVGSRTCIGLIGDGCLGSFDTPSIVNEPNGAFGVKTSPVDTVPESFNSARALRNMVERLKDN